MAEAGTFHEYARIALGMFGIEVDDTDLVVMGSLYEVYGPLQDQLLATDFSQVPPEHDLDPSRAPQEART
jgi:hypothetical protein